MDELAGCDWLGLLAGDAVLQALPEPVWVKDLGGVFRCCNAAFERFFGVSDVVGRIDSELFPETLARAFGREDQALCASPGTRRYVQRVSAPGLSQVRSLEVVQTPMWDASGRLVGILSSGRDITDQHGARDGSWDSETRFHQLFEQIEAISVQGYDRHRRVIYWNPASEVLYGQQFPLAAGASHRRGCRAEMIISRHVSISLPSTAFVWLACLPPQHTRRTRSIPADA